ncbi:MAG: response regulator [Opitutales bacterium]|nr:response regulator [Opitutales bacterium]NRA28448.1 response regulator [Opitutales bacterium]
MKILLIEDSEDDKLILENILFSNSAIENCSPPGAFELIWVETLSKGVAWIAENSCDIVLLDLSLPDSFGPNGIQKLQQLQREFAIIVFTGNLHESVGIESVREGADDYLIKGEFSRGLLVRCMMHAVERRKNKIALARTQSALLEAKLAAEEASDAKTIFLAMMSHEFRTPLQNIQGFVSLLEDTPLDEEQKEYVGIALSNVTKLEILIEDIVDYSKVEKGTLKIVNKAFDLMQTVRETVNMVDRKMTDTGPTIQISIPEPLPRAVVGDSGRLTQILNNLLVNARKFTPANKTIFLRIQGENENQRYRLKCSVEDTGSGIPQEALDTIFAPFKQANPENDQSIGGTGLGLAICKRLCQLMGGHIEIRSNLGLGTCVYFELLFEHTKKTSIDSDNTPHGALALQDLTPEKTLSILVAEDNLQGGVVLEKQLAKLGHECQIVRDGKSAIAQLQRQAFDLILMDTRMPVMNGCEATQFIRQGAAGAHNSNIPIINISANASPEDILKIRDSGMDDHLKKPIRIRDLKDKIEQYSEVVPNLGQVFLFC